MPTTYNLLDTASINAPNGITITFQEDYFAPYELSNFHRRPFRLVETMSNKKIRNIQIRYFNVMYNELQRFIMSQPCQVLAFNLPVELDEDFDIISMQIAPDVDKTVYVCIKNRNTGAVFDEDIREYTIHELEDIVNYIW